MYESCVAKKFTGVASVYAPVQPMRGNTKPYVESERFLFASFETKCNVWAVWGGNNIKAIKVELETC
jgi:hypothetical protein